MIVIVCGVSGSGKSCTASSLAVQFNAEFIEGDDLHCNENRAKMAKGIPLDDTDRKPWLEAIAARVLSTSSRDAFVTCSALKRCYRDTLRTCLVGVECTFVLLECDRDELIKRLENRQGHFMKATMLDSQLSILELPSNEPDVLVVQTHQLDLETIVSRVVSLLLQNTSWRLPQKPIDHSNKP